MDNLSNKNSTYSLNSYEAYVPTPMSSSQQYSNSEFLNMASSSSSTILVSENTVPVARIQQTGNFQLNKQHFSFIVLSLSN